MPEIKKSICPYDCPNTCGLLMEVENGRIVKVKNDPDHPVSRMGICRKTPRYHESIYSDQRILTPLRRSGPKGSRQFTPISWEEAVSCIADTWKKIITEHGGEAILPCSYSGVMSDIQRFCGEAFFARLGASRQARTLCCPAKGAGYKAVAGNTGCLDPRELADSDFYLVWSCNMAADRPQALSLMSRPGNQNKPRILIDTYATSAAGQFDRVILIKAGTDGALALAMMHVLDQEGLSDETFLKKYTQGYEEFRKSLAKYTPEWAEAETGVPADVIRTLARDYAAAKAPVILLGSGLSRYGNGGMTVRLITILSLFTGAWQHPGGGLCGCTPIDTDYVDLDLIRRPDLRTKPARKLNIYQIASSLALTGKEAVRSFYVYGCNPANTVSNQEGVIRGLLREDLFTVVHERFMTETALYADIILPATFSAEQHDIYRCYGHCTLGTARPVIPARGQAKSNWDTFALLAEAMGFEDNYFRRSEEEMLQHILDHPTPAVAALSEKDRQTLQEGGSVSMPFSDHMKPGTSSGKFLIVNEKMAERVPRYIRSYGSRESEQSGCGRRGTDGHSLLRLVASPSPWSLNSEFRDREDLMARRGPQKLILHTADAAIRGIVNGQTVEACNDLACVLFEAVVTDRIARGNAVCEGIYRRDQCPGGRSFNALLSERLTDLGEGTTMNDNMVEVRAHGSV